MKNLQKTGDKQQQGADLSKPRPDEQRDWVDQREPREAEGRPWEAQGGGGGTEQVQLGQPGFSWYRKLFWQDIWKHTLEKVTQMQPMLRLNENWTILSWFSF